MFCITIILKELAYSFIGCFAFFNMNSELEPLVDGRQQQYFVSIFLPLFRISNVFAGL